MNPKMEPHIVIFLVGIIFSPGMKGYTLRNEPSSADLNTNSRNQIDQSVSEQQQQPIARYIVPLANYSTVLSAYNDSPGSSLYASINNTLIENKWIFNIYNKSANESYIRLYSNPFIVLESPETPSQGYVQMFGDVIWNGGIQVWKLEYEAYLSIYRIKNCKTGYYLYLSTFSNIFGASVEVANDETTSLPLGNSLWAIEPPIFF